MWDKVSPLAYEVRNKHDEQLRQLLRPNTEQLALGHGHCYAPSVYRSCWRANRAHFASIWTQPMVDNCRVCAAA
jgi:hypothetical protein